MDCASLVEKSGIAKITSSLIKYQSTLFKKSWSYFISTVILILKKAYLMMRKKSALWLFKMIILLRTQPKNKGQ
jgi:glucose dehydrogenase